VRTEAPNGGRTGMGTSRIRPEAGLIDARTEANAMRGRWVAALRRLVS